MQRNHIQKIGVLRALYMGDLLCIIPTIRAMRHAYPTASITLIGLPWQREFVERFQHYFSDFVEFPGWPGLPEQTVDTKRIPEFLAFMQSNYYDLVVQMQGNGVITNSLCMLFGAATVCGLRRRGEYCPDEKLFPVSEDSDHEVLRFLKLTEALGIPAQGNRLEFPFLSGELERADQHINKWGLAGQQYVCVHPGARDPRRRWPAEYFSIVADRLVEAGYVIVLTGSLAEKDLLENVSSLMRHQPINSVANDKDLSIGELAAVIMRGVALLSNDTGVSHIASALGVPSVIIFSQHSDPDRWAPLNRQLHTTIAAGDSADHKKVLDALLNVIQRPACEPTHLS
jgi:ADP-heptose:LPS heptosyltransferase